VSPEVRLEIERLGVRSVVSSPVLAGQRPCGVVTAVRCGATAFVPADLEALVELAGLVGDAIESAWGLRTSYGWLTLESAPVGMAVSALDGTLIEVNGAFATCVGWQPHELVGRTLQSIMHADDVDLSQRVLRHAIDEGSTALRLEQQRFCHPDGTVAWADLSFTIVRGPDGQAQQLISQAVDVTGRQVAEEELAHQARFDRLTGLPNRRSFTDDVARSVADAEQHGTTVAVLFLDLDRFKLVNESIGHEGGDVVLCEVGRRLRLAARNRQTVGRFGADSFAILCEDVQGAADARRLAWQLLSSLHQPVLVGQREVRGAASVGVAMGGATRPASAASLLREADAACSLAKARGGMTVAIFDEALRDRADERLDVEAALHHAVSRHELRLFYQPEVDLRTGRLVGLEALLRWEHPTLGLLAPEGFLAVAEESGLVVEIGHWVLLAAAEQMGAWRRRWPGLAGVALGVNVAARQLADPELPARVAEARAAAGPGAPLCLEVTETELLASSDQAKLVLAQLRGEGVRVALDDLGTGYASLAYVAGFEADVLKVDRSFTAGLGGVHRAQSAVVTALVSLGRSLGQDMVAEGVETVVQAQHLLELGCYVAQGYLCGKPADADELAPVLEEAAAGRPVFVLQPPGQAQGTEAHRGQPPA
jgi:diguanylate cyclase (GGDEF)-like protein/PAS domain S-box-containing protein